MTEKPISSAAMQVIAELRRLHRRMLADVARRRETADDFEASGDNRTAEVRRHFADGIEHAAELLELRALRIESGAVRKR